MRLRDLPGIIILFFLFIFIVIPLGFLWKIVGYDPMRLSKKRRSETSWKRISKNYRPWDA